MVSLDDFYYSKAERLKRGLRFRAQPGSHDLEAAVRLLTAVRNHESLLNVPRFDHAADDSISPEQFNGPVSTLLFEGWFVGMRDHGYQPLAEQLDYLIYIDCPKQLARDRRFGREEQIRLASGGTRGLSQASMLEFWNEILEPGITRWVSPVREAANLVIQLDSEGRVERVISKDRGR
jgi:pantothenate kinase-related protein Tda10